MILLPVYKEPLLICDNSVNKWRRLHIEEARKRTRDSMKKNKTGNRDAWNRWYNKNKEAVNKKIKLKRQKNPTSHRIANKKWKKHNHEKTRMMNHKYIKTHPENRRKSQKTWNSKNLEYRLNYNKHWRKTIKGKIFEGKRRDFRKSMGSELLNEWFDGCNRHHINSQQIVCIPAELHKQYRHNHKKPETMVEINRIAMQYLFNCKA